MFRSERRRGTHRIGVLAVASLAVAAASVVALVPGGAGAAPSTPSSSSAPASSSPTPAASDAAQAQVRARKAAQRVAQVRQRIETATAQLSSANKAAGIAQGRYENQLAVQRELEGEVRIATALARRTEADYNTVRQGFDQAVLAQYQSGGVPLLGQLMTAQDPDQLIADQQNSALVSTYLSDVVTKDRIAFEANRAAQARKATALDLQRQISGQLRSESQLAHLTVTRSLAALGALRLALTEASTSQGQADQVLSQFLGGWSYADPARASALNKKYLAFAQDAATKKHPRSGSTWSAARGEWAAVRAMLWIGTPYAWAGGNAAGPTQGVCAGGSAENDCHVVGFDCSGLALNGWAPYVAMPHLASSQYSMGSMHPAVGSLMPGDLLFWSSNGQVSGIHHVAVYVGDGNVVQAPQSGDIVRVTPLGSVDSGFFGATRPLT